MSLFRFEVRRKGEKTKCFKKTLDWVAIYQSSPKSLKILVNVVVQFSPRFGFSDT